MIRLLGAITGAALAVALLLLVVGIPQFRAPDAGTRQEIVTLPLPTRTVVDSEPPQTVALAEEAPLPGEANVEDDVTAGEPVAEAAAPAAEAVPDDPFVLAEVYAITEPPPLPADIEPQWYSFWSPFKSEIAANGFVARLQSVTGLDYRIVRVKAGVYEVSFAYREDAEIPGNLSRITAATGLELGDR